MPAHRDPFGRPIPCPPPKDDRISLGKETAPTGSLLVFVKGEPYSLIVMPLGDGAEARVQFRITSMEGKSYQVTVDHDRNVICDCPAWEFSKEVPGPKHCKHCASVKGSGLVNLIWSKS